MSAPQKINGKTNGHAARVRYHDDGEDDDASPRWQMLPPPEPDHEDDRPVAELAAEDLTDDCPSADELAAWLDGRRAIRWTYDDLCRIEGLINGARTAVEHGGEVLSADCQERVRMAEELLQRHLDDEQARQRAERDEHQRAELHARRMAQARGEVPPDDDDELVVLGDVSEIDPLEAVVLRHCPPEYGESDYQEQLKKVEQRESQLQEWDAAQLDAADFDTTYLIEGMLVAGQPLIVAGPQKSLKTSLALAAGISLASGKPFLGRRTKRKAVVGIMSGESGAANIQATCRRICRSLGIRLPDLAERLRFRVDLPQIDNLYHMLELERWLLRREIEVLVMDPAYMCIPGDEAGNLFVMGQRLRAIAELCQRCKCTLILLHHTKRGVLNPDDPPELADIAWAGFAEFARQWWLLGRREKYEPGTGSHKLWFSAGHSSLLGIDIDESATGQILNGLPDRHWRVRVLSAEEARKKAKAAKARERQADASAQVEQDLQHLLDALQRLPAGETERALRTLAGLSRDRLTNAISRATKQGLIETISLKKNGQQYEGYRLRETPDALPG